jgi:hypothetical protein
MKTLGQNMAWLLKKIHDRQRESIVHDLATHSA